MDILIRWNAHITVSSNCSYCTWYTIDVCIVDIDRYNLQNALVYTTKDDTCEHVIQRKHL